MKVKKKLKPSAPKKTLYTVTIHELTSTTIDRATVVEHNESYVVLLHKKPRSSKMLRRVVPMSAITSLYIGEAGEAEVTFRTPTLLSSFDATIESSSGAIISFKDEDGIINRVNTANQSLIVEIVAEADDQPAKKAKSPATEEKSKKVKSADSAKSKKVKKKVKSK